MDCWLHSDTLFPIMSSYFKYDFIWFDVEEDYTKASINKLRNGEEYNAIITQQGFISP